MPSNTLKLFLLIALVFGGSLIIYGTVPESLSPLQRENESSRKLHPKLNLHAEKFLDFSEEKVGNFDVHTTHSETKNSRLPTDIFKAEGLEKAVPHVKSFRARFRRHARKKRNTKDKFLPWKFNLNVSRLDPHNPEFFSERDITVPKLSMEKSGKQLEIALHVKGNDLDDSYSEMHHAWDSVENFLRQLFGGNIEELNERGHSVFVDLNGLPSKVHTGGVHNPGNDETQSQQKDKEGKFLFGFFGPGGNGENPPIEKENEEALDNGETTEALLAMSSPVNDVDPTTISEIFDNFPNALQQEESVTPKESEGLGMASEEKLTSDDPKTLSIHLTESTNENGLLPDENEQSKRIDKSKIFTRSKSITENVFAEQDLAEFCINLLHRIKKSPRLLEEFNYLEGSGSVGLEENGAISKKVTSSNQILTASISQQKPQSMGFFASILNRITGGRTRPEPSTTRPEPSTTSTEPSSNENENRKARIFNFTNFFGNFGSGRSADVNEFENIKFDDMDFNTTKNTDTGVFTVSDCEAYFNHIRDATIPTESSILNRSTLMELVPNFKEDFSLEEKSTSFSTENLQDTQGKRFLNVLLGSGDTINLKLESTEDNVFGVSTLKNHRSEEFLSDQNTENSLTLTTASPDLRIFPGFFNFGSGERGLGESFQFEVDNTPDVTTDKDERTFAGFWGFGSGERQMQEKVESLSTNFMTNEISNSENASVHELPIQDEYNETYLDFANYEGNHGLDSIVDELQTRMAKEEQRAYSDVFERQDALIPVMETDQDRHFIRYPSVGSGDGRELEESENSISRNETNSGCSVICTIENGTDVFIKCTECPFESTPDIPLEASIETSHNSTESEIALGVVSSHAEYKNTRPVNMSNSYQTDKSSRRIISSHVEYTDTKAVNQPDSYQIDELSRRDQKDIAENRLSPNPSGTITATSKNETESKESILNGKIFWNLREENGQINLVQETELTSPPSSFSPRNSRKGRLVDDAFDSKDVEPENNFKDTGANGERSKDSNDLHETSSKVTSTSQELRTLDNSTESTKPFFEDIGQVSKQTERSEDEFIGSISTLPPNQESSEHGTPNSSVLTTEPVRTFIQRRFGTEARYCVTDDQCNKSLNERCMSKTTMGICDCGKYFVRHSVTGKCEDPIRLKAQLRFPGEVFNKELKDDNSDYFHKMRKDSVNTMRIFVGQDPYLRDALVRVEVQDFEQGSLIVNYDLTFAKENKSTIEIMQRVDIAVSEAVENEDLWKKTPLNTIDAQVMSVGIFGHRCDIKELNYCSVNAKCLPLGDFFKCQCKDGYLDNSREGYTGEVCVEYCPLAYCGDNGYCDTRFDGERTCLCRGWYFGERCQIPGLLVIGGFGVFNIALVLIILGIVCICRRRRHRRARYYGSDTPTINANESFGRLSAVPSRLQDIVAMNEMGAGGATKYTLRSTPVQGIPDINVISPSNTGSSISYDFDSTFDRSVNIEEANKTARL